MLNTSRGEDIGEHFVISENIAKSLVLTDMVYQNQKRVQLLLVGQNGKTQQIGEAYDGQYFIGNVRYPHVGIEIGEKYRGQGFGKYLFSVYTDFFSEYDIELAPATSIGLIRLYISVGYKTQFLVHKHSGKILYAFNEDKNSEDISIILQSLGENGIENITVQLKRDTEKYKKLHDINLALHSSETRYK